MKIAYSRLALFDLKNIYEFILKDSFQYARKEVKSIRTVIEQLKSQPNIGKPFEFRKELLIRELVFKHYRIIYEITPEQIRILSIHHSSRSLQNNPIANDFDID